MTEPRPLVMRIARPYKTVQEFLQGDGSAIGRTSMLLWGAPARVPGIIIRFEVTLNSGAPVFRGEGRVIAYRCFPSGQQGLEVRFTRLEPAAKALLEQLAARRRQEDGRPQKRAAAIPDLTPLSTDEPLSFADSVGAKEPELVESERPPMPVSGLRNAEAHRNASELTVLPPVAPVEKTPQVPDVLLDQASEPASAVAMDVEAEEPWTPTPGQQTRVQAAPVSMSPVPEGAYEIGRVYPIDLDDGPTPYAPPVVFADDVRAIYEPWHEPEPVRLCDDYERAPLGRLRGRRSLGFERPLGKESILARLRHRFRNVGL